jgi:cell wall-associated NlpC family hydrolase
MQRHRHRQVAQSFTTIRHSLKPFICSPLQTVQKLPRRYILHTIVALVVPVAVGLSQLPTLPQAQPGNQTAVLADSPLSLNPISLNDHTEDGIVVGDPPLPETDAIPVPMSLTSRSEALAPLTVPATIVADTSAKVRNGPGTEYDEIGRLDSSQNLQVIGRSGDWLLIRGEQGRDNFWVASEFVAISDADRAAIFEVNERDIPAVPPPKVATVRESGLSLRDGPGTNYVKMQGLEAGQEIALIEQYQDWFHVAGDGFEGWVTSEYLDVGEGIVERVPVTETIPDANPALAAMITSDQVNMRKGPGTAYDRVDQLGSGAQVNVLARHDDWVKIETGYGTVAWIFRDLLDMSPMVARRIPYTDNIPALPRPPVVASRSTSSSTAAAPAAQPAAPAAPAAQPAAQPEPLAPAPPPVVAPASGDVASFAMQFVGYNYIYGGASPSGFDCSGLVQYVYAQYGVYLPHNAAAQFSTAYGTSIGNTANLAPGDVVFFAGTAGPGISHVGIYIGGGRLVHAMSPGYGVQVSNLYDSYWISHYAGAIRPYR